MRYRHYLFFIFFVFILNLAEAQLKQPADTADMMKELDEVIVTATKTERKAGSTGVPVSIISRQTIKESGSLRLNDILAEQPGLFITNSFGSGVQMQGLAPDYTLILIDGEPLVGRTSGVLDLSRITTANIKKIEIVKGPSSVLYGSEALAGVINIITDKARETSANASVRYGSYGTTDINAGAGFVKDKLNLSVQANRYGTSGYKLNNTPAQTVDPFRNYSLQFTSAYDFSPASKWTFYAKYFNQVQHIKPYALKDAASNMENISGSESITEINILNTLEHIFSAKVKSQLRLYYTSYQAVTNQQFIYSDTTQSSFYYDYFHQQFLRAEEQVDITLNKKTDVAVGAGLSYDNVRSNRYDDIATVSRDNSIGYLFAQCEWRPVKTWNITGGVRYDHNETYQSRLSPKLSIQKNIGSKLSIYASAGGGFKAPDFRQLYLNFTNSSVGYTVLGNTEVEKGFSHLQQEGQIQSVLIDPSTIQSLKPETSTGINIGARYSILKNAGFTINFFRNDIRNLIITGMIAQKTNNQFVYSYFNVNRAYSKGLESSFNCQLLKNIKLEIGYQLLYTADKDQLAAIKAGKVFARDNGNVYQLTTKDYKGLFDRSRHMADLKIYYETKPGWFANLRNAYRSSWGVNDVDGNLYLNRGDAFAKEYIRTNITAGRSFSNGIRIQVGSDNIFNYRDTKYLPEEPGRTGYFNISYSIIQHKK